MKRLQTGLIWIVLTLMAMSSHGQAIVAQFGAIKADGVVSLSWMVTEGNTCNGIEIERSTDGIAFAEIGRIAGVCGSFNSAQRFDFSDLAPVANQINYYRLSTRGDLISDTIQIEIVNLGSGNYLAWPNPFAQSCSIYFENTTHEEHALTLYGASGNVRWAGTTRTERFDLEGGSIENGVYYFVIHSADGARITRGKLIVAH